MYKTAMQELSEWLQAYEYELPLELQIKAKEALEKEKEQIIDAFEVGYKSCDIDEAFEINRKLANGELYYNQTYNQNK
jgi:N-acetyl-anhydromuramyl-L-alanine amidase AmpD